MKQEPEEDHGCWKCGDDGGTSCGAVHCGLLEPEPCKYCGETSDHDTRYCYPAPKGAQECAAAIKEYEMKEIDAAIDALEAALSDDQPYIDRCNAALADLRSLKQEPVAWATRRVDHELQLFAFKYNADREAQVHPDRGGVIPLYTHPAPEAKPHLFEFWWAEYMPDATQGRAWAAWQAAPRADGVEVAAPEAKQPVNQQLLEALRLAEAALSDIGDADREPGDDVAWCEARAAKAIPAARAAIAAAEQSQGAKTRTVETDPAKIRAIFEEDDAC